MVQGDFLGRQDGARAEGEEWERAHHGAIGADRWVLDAMRFSTLDERVAAADTVIFLDLPRRSLLVGIVRRRLRHGGRIDPETGVADVINRSLLRWVWRFHQLDRPSIMSVLARHRTTTGIVVLRSRAEARRFAEHLHGPSSDPVDHEIPSSRAFSCEGLAALLVDHDEAMTFDEDFAAAGFTPVVAWEGR